MGIWFGDIWIYFSENIVYLQLSLAAVSFSFSLSAMSDGNELYIWTINC